ncbi:MAG: glycoside hydrolase family 127 protein [Bacteroidota bacterium]|nr:glycoside hydrolase family 127 protein [Bacteroidota bacterium]
MKKLFAICFLLCSQSCIHAQTPFKVKNTVPAKAIFFPLSDVRLLPGLFKDAMDEDVKYLLSLDPDRFLHRFRTNAGLNPKAPIYGGWESRGVSGHSLGHYLSACSMMFAASDDIRFKIKVDYIVNELDECQRARKTGYVGAIPGEDSLWDQVAAGDIRSQGFDLNGAWVPWYTLHKMLAGLVDAYQYEGNTKALQIATKFCDWIDVKFKNLSEDQFQQMLECEQGGMNEALANVYALTGNKKYLALSYRFDHKKILDPLADDEDILPGKHANTQIPKVIGTARQYELTGNKKNEATAVNFWNMVTVHHSYVTGGNSDFEHFSKPDELSDHLNDNTTETCNSYNMLKLTRQLFELKPDAHYMDYYERTLYNHILGSIDPDDGMTTYYVPLVAGGEKTYSTPTESFWCCTGTGMENHVKYGESIYARGSDGSLYVNLFIPSTLTWKERNLQIKMETSFPNSNDVILKIVQGAPHRKGNSKGENFPIYIRYPSWAKEGLTVAINDKPLIIKKNPGSYYTIERVWKAGDKISIGMKLYVHAESMPNNKNRIALLYGPIVLSGELGKEKPAQQNIPVFVSNDADVSDLVKPVANSNTIMFQTSATSAARPVSLIPFYEMHYQHYIVYWDKFTTAGWNEKKKEYEAELKRQEEIKAMTVDMLRVGEMQPERDHNFKGEKTNTGKAFGRRWRDANEGGWFSFTLNTKGYKNLQLVDTYWGSDNGNRNFDILIDDVKIASQKLQAEKPNEFFDVYYDIPESLLEGKQEITVRLQAMPGSTLGGLFDCRLLKKGD